MGHILGPVLRDLKRYDLVPKRREPYDPSMHRLARRLAGREPDDGLVAALVNGFEAGFVAAYRLTEWAQPAGRTDPMKPVLNHLVSMGIRTRALVPADLSIITDGRERAGV